MSWSKSQKWLESILVNTAASMFDINLKTKYAPDVNEDYLIETILVRLSIREDYKIRIQLNQLIMII
jgi:hypothetical protein